MKHAIIAVGLVIGLGAAPAFSSSSTWRVVKAKSANRQFAATAASATIRHPRGIAVRILGAHGTAAWGCSKGVSISSWHRSYGRGLHVLGHVAGKDNCDVVASVSGSGRVTVQILKWV